MIIDKLYDRVKDNGHVCVGLDTDMAYIPENFRQKFIFPEDALFRFNQKIIDATFDKVACYKIQIAYYEALGLTGLTVYKKIIEYIKELGCIVISDIKRGDIANTAKMYAKAHFEGDFETDFITLNPYMGMDTIKPYLSYVRNDEKGIFTLVRTSNEGAKDIEYISSIDSKRVYEIVSDKVETLGKEYLGQCGYSSIGGVIGCTHVDEALKLRNNMKTTFFLIPGYGAQGGTADDVALYLKDGNGGVVNSSRGILLAYKRHENILHFEDYSRQAVINMRDDILNAVKKLKDK
ncbi:orotidine-5'-phosphate decarboxylase [Clostridium rectalis]|uniref:orotidine-5'-phosphate decarboxylase n=1 Tax=Clostridium rectalis TaxID=2040295 RepID=UPI000F632449|nr:orotidine-5'-phosphate decarboxylase [Clostridium rectalis]